MACGGSSAEASSICPRKIRLLPKLMNSFKSIIPQTALPFPMNDNFPAHLQLFYVFFKFFPQHHLLPSLGFMLSALPLPSLFFPTFVSIAAKKKAHPSLLFCQACWKKLCRESGARFPHGSPDLWSSEMSFPSLQVSVVDEEPLQVFREVRTTTFTWELQHSPMLSLLPEESVHSFFQDPEIQRR